MEKIRYPANQRRIRSGQAIRELTATVHLSHKAFVQPLFVEEGLKSPRFVEGLRVDSPDSVQEHLEECLENEIQKFLLFPIPSGKQTHEFDFSFAAETVRRLKQASESDTWIAADLCLCSYTTHGHCGHLNKEKTQVANNATVETLVAYAVQLAAAGADCIAPSDMMDGRIGAIRTQLDALGYDLTSIMSYAIKFSSQYYGPFRDCCHSAPQNGQLKNRKSYQLSPFNANDGLQTALRDEKEGADILMVKPAGLYTDMIYRLRAQTLKPIAAYQVSGEYAAIETMAEKGLLNRKEAHVENWAAIIRSGANMIISYAAKNAKNWIDQIEY